MSWLNAAKGLAVVALASAAPIETGAIEIGGGSSPAGVVNRDLIVTVAQAPKGSGLRIRAPRNQPVARNAHVNRTVHANVNVKLNRNIHVNGSRPGHPGNGPGRPESIPGGKPRVVGSGGPGHPETVPKLPLMGSGGPGHPEPVLGAKPPVVGGQWARPGWYHWPPGGAVAAGVALGFIPAATATWAATPPKPGLCWFYISTRQQDGFWDACP